MTWVVPEPDPVDEPFTGSERSILDGFLEAQRYQFLRRCAGLDGAQLLEASAAPSNLSLLRLMRHLTNVERHWIRNRFGGANLPMAYDDAFGATSPAEPPSVYQRLREEWTAARVALAALDLGATYSHPRHGPISLRWLYPHMVREYAGHIGHADLLRQRIDGSTFS